MVINPTPDAVQEFQAITSGLSAAEYRRTGGGVFSVVLKSGTNAFHGDGYGFLATMRPTREIHSPLSIQ